MVMDRLLGIKESVRYFNDKNNKCFNLLITMSSAVTETATREILYSISGTIRRTCTICPNGGLWQSCFPC